MNKVVDPVGWGGCRFVKTRAFQTRGVAEKREGLGGGGKVEFIGQSSGHEPHIVWFDLPGLASR